MNRKAYLSWKRKNVTIRGIGKNYGGEMLGRGLYSAFLSNRVLAKQYGDVVFVLGGYPERPLVFGGLNEWEIWSQRLKIKFAKEGGHDYRDYSKYRDLTEDIMALGYDGVVIRGREMVNYVPKNVMFFDNEFELEKFYEENVASLNEAYWHGSGADFDVFNLDFLGSGSGSQAYGKGIYLTELKSVADGFARHVSKDKFEKYSNMLFGVATDRIRQIIHQDTLIRELLNYLEIVASTLKDSGAKQKFLMAMDSDKFVKFSGVEWGASLLDAVFKDLREVIKNIPKPDIKAVTYSIVLKKENPVFFNWYNLDGRKIYEQLVKEGIVKDFGLTKDEILVLAVDGEIKYVSNGTDLREGLNMLGYSDGEFSDFLANMGYDGVYVPDLGAYVVFDPNIIRIVEKTNV